MLMKNNDKYIRVLDTRDENALVIDCIKKTMPVWKKISELESYKETGLSELCEATKTVIPDMSELDNESAAVVQKKFSLISPVLESVSDEKRRSEIIREISKVNGVSKQTIRSYLCTYLIYMDKAALVPVKTVRESALTADQKNIRWALNKYFYTSDKNSLQTAYTQMLKEKYCDVYGILNDKYPSFYQFRYFYRKTKKLSNFYISRNGRSNYQRTNRPLLGGGIQEYAKNVGMGMLDSTICDVYLINDEGSLVGRPILTVCIDAYSGLCCGYALTWEGGVYSLRALMVNIVSDKVRLCESLGIGITRSQWDCDMLPGTLVTDKGSEYRSANFEQLAELGVSIVNLPAYRPELKGAVEKFFDMIQNMFLPLLKKKGAIQPDFRERGAPDYRKDAVLTMSDFEKIVVKCIVFYNCFRVIENFPYTKEMLASGVQPYSSSVWEWGKRREGANLIKASAESVIRTLMPRTIGKFARNGFIVNKLRYKNKNYMEKYLSGGTASAAYDPDDVSFVWLIENGKYVKFELIETRFENDSLEEVQKFRDSCKNLISENEQKNLQAKVELAKFIEAITDSAERRDEINLDSVRETRKKERERTHIDFMNGGFKDDN